MFWMNGLFERIGTRPMGERIFRPGIRTSEKIAANIRDGGWLAGVFYDWLITLVDDFGRYDARPFVLRTQLFPALLDLVREADVSRCLQSCAAAGLVRLYEVDGEPFLEVTKWKQRLRAKTSKWPSPQVVKKECHDKVVTMPSETETETFDDDCAGDGLDAMDSEVHRFFREHSMLSYSPKGHSEVRKLVESAGWENTRRYIDEAVSRGASDPPAYARTVWAGEQAKARLKAGKKRQPVIMREEN